MEHDGWLHLRSSVSSRSWWGLDDLFCLPRPLPTETEPPRQDDLHFQSSTAERRQQPPPSATTNPRPGDYTRTFGAATGASDRGGHLALRPPGGSAQGTLKPRPTENPCHSLARRNSWLHDTEWMLGEGNHASWLRRLAHQEHRKTARAAPPTRLPTRGHPDALNRHQASSASQH